jgi:hypothetical protein
MKHESKTLRLKKAAFKLSGIFNLVSKVKQKILACACGKRLNGIMVLIISWSVNFFQLILRKVHLGILEALSEFLSFCTAYIIGQISVINTNCKRKTFIFITCYKGTLKEHILKIYVNS